MAAKALDSISESKNICICIEGRSYRYKTVSIVYLFLTPTTITIDNSFYTHFTIGPLVPCLCRDHAGCTVRQIVGEQSINALNALLQRPILIHSQLVQSIFGHVARTVSLHVSQSNYYNFYCASGGSIARAGDLQREITGSGDWLNKYPNSSRFSRFIEQNRNSDIESSFLYLMPCHTIPSVLSTFSSGSLRYWEDLLLLHWPLWWPCQKVT